MLSEQQVAKELMVRGWGFTYLEELDKIHSALKEAGIPPSQALQLIEASTELKDANFRAAAFDLLELKKRTGKSSKEAEVYIQSLGVEITSNEKQNSDWIAKAEKAKDDFRVWEQRRNDERLKFESEQAENKRTLKEDGEKLNLELRENNQIRANVQVTIELQTDLSKIGLDLPTFKSIVRETVLKGGINRHIAKSIKEAVKTFVSLGKAIVEREREEKAKKKAILNLSREEREKKELLRVFDKSITLKHEKSAELSKQLDLERKLLVDQYEQIEQNKSQWEFFQMFISMLLTSPSAPESLAPIALKLQELELKGWRHSGGLTLSEQRRGLFVCLVMGTYLHSIHCSNCKASFIVNKAHNAYTQWRSSYCCPVCDLSSYTEPDDSFLNLMISPDLIKKLQDARYLLDIMEKNDFEALAKKLKLLDSIPDEVYKALLEGRKIAVQVSDATD